MSPVAPHGRERAAPGHTAGDRPLLLSYRALGLGDLLTVVPALRALRAAFPEHHHVLATSAWLAPLVARIDAVDEHLPAEELAPLPPLPPPDMAVDLHGNGPQSRAVVAATRPRRLLAFHDPAAAGGRGGAPRWAPPGLAEEREPERWCRLLAEHGIPADPDELDLPPPPGPAPAAARAALVVHPGAKARARRWPWERFAAVAAHEHGRGRTVVVTGGPDERGLATAVADRAGLPAGAVLAGAGGVDELARTLAAAARVVCGDTGVAHLATALGTPSVVLFGPMTPARWGPPPARRDRHRVLWSGRRGDPLADEVDPGLLRIEVSDVLDELHALDAAGARR